MRLTSKQAWLLRAFCGWTVYVWVTFIWNVWHDHVRSTGFKVVHTVIAIVSMSFAAAAFEVVRRNRATVAPLETGRELHEVGR